MRSNSHRRSQSETKQAILRPSSELDRIDKALFLMATRLGKTITAERINLWHQDLSSYPVDAIEFCFDAWGRNAKVLPTLSDILGLIRTWHKDTDFTTEDEHHGQGYGWPDLKWLWNQRMCSAGKWDADMYEAALTALDQRREQGAPEFRR
jgi:hypothetical protein